MAKWTDLITNLQWKEWTSIAMRASAGRNTNTSLGSEEYAAQAMEKLIQEDVQPVNVEAWLRLVVNRLYIDRFRKVEKRGGASLRGASDAELEREVIHQFAGVGLSTAHLQREEVARVMSVLNGPEYDLIMMHLLGFDNHEIASELGYKTNKVVATRIKQIKNKIVECVGSNPL